jgi:tetratricopeptide (TPR) repeat protein
MHLNEFDEALYHINKFNADGTVMKIMKNGLLGDIHSENKNWEKAIGSYKDASSYNNNLLTPYYLNKLALLQDRQGLKDEARSSFKKIKEEYPESNEVNEAVKYLALQE